MNQDIVEQFRTWGIKQYNKDGKLYEKKSISNYHSSLNTILKKLGMVDVSGFSKVYDCCDTEEFERLYYNIFSHPKFVEVNNKSNHTHSSALNLYRRFVYYLDALNSIPVLDIDFKSDEISSLKKAKRLSDEELEKRISIKRNKLSKEQKIISIGYVRDQEIAEYALRRANGKCDLCQNAAPFIKHDGTPYLEVHHVDWLSRGGEDVIENVSAVCPNCHRRIHILDEKEDTLKLKKRMLAYGKLLKETRL